MNIKQFQTCLFVISVERFKESVLRCRQGDTQFRRCILLYLVEEPCHLLHVQLRGREVNLFRPVTYHGDLPEELLAVVHVHLILGRARFVLDALHPHPQEIILCYAPLLRHLLHGDLVRAILQRRKDVG